MSDRTSEAWRTAPYSYLGEDPSKGWPQATQVGPAGPLIRGNALSNQFFYVPYVPVRSRA